MKLIFVNHPASNKNLLSLRKYHAMLFMKFDSRNLFCVEKEEVRRKELSD